MRKEHIKFFILVVLGILTYSSIAEAQSTRYTRTFVYEASIGNQFEIRSSQIALEKSKNEAVKNFAWQMISDHKKAYDDLKTLAAPNNDNSSNVMYDVDAKHQQMLNLLQAANGKDFDKLYVQYQTEAHADAVKLFKDYTNDGYDATIRYYANQTLPVLMQHSQHVEMLRTEI